MSAGSRAPYSLVLLAALVFAVYANTLAVPFVFDDFAAIVENPFVRDPSLLCHPEQAALPGEQGLSLVMLRMRPVGVMSFALNAAVHGITPAGFHLVNILIHLLNTFLVYAVVLELFRTPFLRTGAAVRNARTIGLFAAALFAVHPVQTQAVTYIVQRFTSLATMFYLFSFYSFLRWRASRRAVPAPPGAEGRRISWSWYGCMIVSAAAAMKTKEISFTLPFIITVCELFFFDGPRRPRIAMLLPLWLTALIVPCSLLTTGPVPETIAPFVNDASRAAAEIPRSDYLLTQTRAVLLYLRLLVFPAGQNLDHDLPVSHSLAGPGVLPAMLVLAAMAALAAAAYIRSRRGEPALRLAAFGVIWFFIALSVESSFIPLSDTVMEHRIYLPSAGMFLSISAAFGLVVEAGGKARSAVAAAVVMVAVLAGTAVARNAVWRDEVRLWSDVVRKSPDKARGHVNLGMAYGRRGEYRKSIEVLSRAISLDPDVSFAYYNRGVAYLLDREPDRAFDDLTRSIKLYPFSSKAYYQRARAAYDRSQRDAALDDLTQAVTLDPGFGDAFHGRGMVLAELGRTGAAVKDLLHACGLGTAQACEDLRQMRSRE